LPSQPAGRLGLALGSGSAGLGAGDTVAIVERHGDPYALPHRIDHAANMRRLRDAGCERVLALGSVGGLHPQYGPGTFVCADDFIALGAAATTLEGRDAHRVRGFDREWRGRVIEAWNAEAEPPLVDGGVYWQTLGPRLETPAEIRHIARDADVIGMTIASECVAAAELGLSYAAVCTVVNYANGVGDTPLTIEELHEGERHAREQLAAALASILPALAAAAG